MPKILVIGSTGLVGSRFLQIPSDLFSIITLGRNYADIKIDLTQEDEVFETVQSSDAIIVVNFAAYTNVDEAEKQKGDTKGEVYAINTLLPLWLAKSCQDSGKKFFHISTDYVFDGKQLDRSYTEEDSPTPVDSWYSITKYFGEQKILSIPGHKNNFAIIRISYPFSSVYKRKLDIARTVIEKLRNKKQYFGISDQKIKPTSVDDITQALFFLLDRKATGIYHIAGNYSPQEYITPYQFAQKIANSMNLDTSLIKPISFLNLSKKRVAPRPQHTWLNTKKIESMGFQVTNIDEALKKFKYQMLNE